MVFIKIHQTNTHFWRFQSAFWLTAFVTLFLSGLSQGMSGDMAFSRNALYVFLGSVLSLLFLPLWEFSARRSSSEIVAYLLSYAFGVGIFCTVLVNQYLIFLFELSIEHPRLVYLFGGTLNFSLVMLVWCGFYLSLKRGLSFEHGAEEQETAKAIASISNLTAYPEYIALERLGKISLLPIAKVSLIKASGDYVEFTCEGDDNSKNETYLKRSTISNIQKMLDPKFFQRVHRSAIVNLKQIRELEPKGRGDYTMLLLSGEQVACSRTYMDELKGRLDIAL